MLFAQNASGAKDGSICTDAQSEDENGDDDGEMRFDYRMRQGVPTRTNGRNVMRVLGLAPNREDE
jgi:hypothetical protein